MTWCPDFTQPIAFPCSFLDYTFQCLFSKSEQMPSQIITTNLSAKRRKSPGRWRDHETQSLQTVCCSHEKHHPPQREVLFMSRRTGHATSATETSLADARHVDHLSSLFAKGRTTYLRWCAVPAASSALWGPSSRTSQQKASTADMFGLP